MGRSITRTGGRATKDGPRPFGKTGVGRNVTKPGPLLVSFSLQPRIRGQYCDSI
jgi:hypothetical protein